jgi:stage III sporulation protein AF
MEAIRQWATSICVTIVIVAIFSMLVPKGSMEKVVKFTVSVFFLISLLYPLMTNIGDFTLDVSAEYTEGKQDTSQLEESMNQKLLDITQAKIVRQLEQILHNNEIETKKIEVIININEDNSILISKLVIKLDSSYKSEESKIKKIVKEETQKAPEIEYIKQ